MYLFAGSLVCLATASLSAYNWISPSLAAATRDSISFLPLVSVVLMYTGFGLGYGPIVFMLQGGNKWRIKVQYKTLKFRLGPSTPN